MAAKFINVTSGGSTQVYETHAETIGQLFNSEFREDFNISSTGLPTVNGVVASNDTPLTAGVTVGYQNTASSKSG
ncbi:MAG: hypothetical protein ACPH5P_00115 [Akkermansiaceae bacterium]